MLEWLINNWGWLLSGLLFSGYFAFYVLAMRVQRTSVNADKPRLPCDRC